MHLQFTTPEGQAIHPQFDQLVIAGWAGRDAAAAQRAEQARSDKADYEERARKAAEKKAEKERKNAAGAPPATDALLPGK